MVISLNVGVGSLFAENLQFVNIELAADGALEEAALPTAGYADDDAVALVCQDFGIWYILWEL